MNDYILNIFYRNGKKEYCIVDNYKIENGCLVYCRRFGEIHHVPLDLIQDFTVTQDEQEKNITNLRLTIKKSIIHYLCDNWNNHKRGKTHKENQAIFDKEDGCAVFSGTDLKMVMDKVVLGIWSINFEEIFDKYVNKETIKEILWNQKYSDTECLEKIAELVGIHRK